MIYIIKKRVFWSACGEIDWRRGTTRMVGMGETANANLERPPGRFSDRLRFVGGGARYWAGGLYWDAGFCLL